MIDHRTAPYAALVLRLSLSLLFFAHVYRKFAVIGFDSWWSGLAKQGYADWMLSYTVAIELAGAVLLLLGIYTRYISTARARAAVGARLTASCRFWLAASGPASLFSLRPWGRTSAT